MKPSPNQVTFGRSQHGDGERGAMSTVAEIVLRVEVEDGQSIADAGRMVRERLSDMDVRIVTMRERTRSWRARPTKPEGDLDE